MSIEIVLPAPLQAPGAALAARAAIARRAVPSAPRIGLIDNTKPRAAPLLEAIGRRLVARGLASSSFVWSKASAARSITAAERDALLARADVLICGVGD